MSTGTAGAAGTATAAVEVPCDPDKAFSIFTADIGTWWRRGTYYWIDPERGLSLRFEPHVGGRLIEVYDAGSGEGHEIGRVTAWEPGERLVFTWRIPDWPDGATTVVAVAFTAVAAGTRVTIEHSGWEGLDPQLPTGYSRGWAELLGFYAEAV
jgi:uncharacterized protein YndB with AHSA1/START domain